MKGRMQAQPGGNRYHAFMAGGLEHVRAHLGHAQPHGDRRVHTRACGQRHQHAYIYVGNVAKPFTHAGEVRLIAGEFIAVLIGKKARGGVCFQLKTAHQSAGRLRLPAPGTHGAQHLALAGDFLFNGLFPAAQLVQHVSRVVLAQHLSAFLQGKAQCAVLPAGTEHRHVPCLVVAVGGTLRLLRVNQPLPLIMADAFRGQVEQPCKIADFITHKRLRLCSPENSKAGLSFLRGSKKPDRFPHILSQSGPCRILIFFRRSGGACFFPSETV